MASHATLSEKTSPLRIGILLDSLTQPRWVEHALRMIDASGAGKIVLVVHRQVPTEPANRWQTLWRNRDRLVYAAYTRFDQRYSNPDTDPFATTPLGPLIAGVPLMRVTPKMTKFSDYVNDDDVNAILEYELDVALRFGFRILKGRVLSIAKYGVWSYHHADNRVNRGGPAGFWEVMENQPVTGSILQVLSEELDAGRVLYRSYASTNRLSVLKNRENYYWKSAEFIVRKIREVHAQGSDALELACDESAWVAYGNRMYSVPRNGEMIRLLARLGGRLVRSKLDQWLRREQWLLAYRFRPTSREAMDVPDATPYRFKMIHPPRHHSWADPFPVLHDGKYFVFFEEATPGRKGHISVLELDPRSGAAKATKVLERDYHLSYPFVFRWSGQWYMIPETGERRTVELFRATSFPHEWEFDRILLTDIAAVDATLFEEPDRWWMFVNIAPHGASAWDELHLYHAETPLGPWTPHRRNPVKSDVRSARPAGRLFEHGGRLYRPSQDCSVAYGYAVKVNRVERLDEQAFDETEVSRMIPAWLPGLRGTHTLNAAGALTVIDVRVSRWRFARG